MTRNRNKISSPVIEGIEEETAGVRIIPALNKRMEVTFNYIKHADKSSFRQWTINNFYKEMLKQLSEYDFSTILDVGCGEGFTLDRLAKDKLTKTKIGNSLVGVDNSRAAINLGKALFPKLNLKLGDIYNLPFKDDSMDLVICTEVLEHLRRPREALKELVRVSGKYLLLSVPNEPFFCLKNLIRGRNIKRLGSTRGHISQWTSWGFRRFVNQEKATIIKTKHPFPFTMLFVQKVE